MLPYPWVEVLITPHGDLKLDNGEAGVADGHSLITPHGDLKPPRIPRLRLSLLASHYPSWGFETACGEATASMSSYASLPLMGI